MLRMALSNSAVVPRFTWVSWLRSGWATHRSVRQTRSGPIITPL